ncbi:MAG: hypothetical protein IJF92_03390 [Bacilli bacterium]|nr:hypothetical protein [Bacilli bacterium]
MEDVIYYNELYDLYSKLLTEKQQKYFEDYYFNNLSLGEMADLYKVSRNAIFKQIHNVTKKLEDYENKLGLLNKKKDLINIINTTNDKRVKNDLNRVIDKF